MNKEIANVVTLLLLVSPDTGSGQAADAQGLAAAFAIPFGLSAVEGNSGRSAPFNSEPGTGTRYQQVYDARQFPVSATERAVITHL